MWGPAGPEGESSGPVKAADKSENAINSGKAGGNFGDLLGDEDDEEDRDEQQEPDVPEGAIAVDYSVSHTHTHAHTLYTHTCFKCAK